MRKRKIIIILSTLLTIIICITIILINILNKPIVNKNHNLLFTIKSDGNMDCGYVIMKVYDDNTYEYYGSYSNPPSIGKYNYDANKVLLNINNYKIGNGKYSYIIIDSKDNKYYVDNEYPEIKKFLESIPMQMIKANLNRCPN